MDYPEKTNTVTLEQNILIVLDIMLLEKYFQENNQKIRSKENILQGASKKV